MCYYSMLYVLHYNKKVCFMYCRLDSKKIQGLRPPGEHWSGEATRGQGFAVQETRVDVTIGEADRSAEEVRKERPVWMVESTVITSDPQVSIIIMFSVINLVLLLYMI